MRELAWTMGLALCTLAAVFLTVSCMWCWHVWGWPLRLLNFVLIVWCWAVQVKAWRSAIRYWKRLYRE